MLRKKLVVANRSEIACRIIKTARKMNLTTAVITIPSEKDSLPVLLADESIEVSSFLNATEIVEKANAWGAKHTCEKVRLQTSVGPSGSTIKHNGERSAPIV